jgi:hypothetical protein
MPDKTTQAVIARHKKTGRWVAVNSYVPDDARDPLAYTLAMNRSCRSHGQFTIVAMSWDQAQELCKRRNEATELTARGT